MKKFILLIIILLTLVSCNDPHLIDNNTGIVVKVERITNYKEFKYKIQVEYHSVKMDMADNFAFFSNKSYMVGDTIKIY